MGFLARHRLVTSTFTATIALEALERSVPAALIQVAATAAPVPTERWRNLPSDVTLLLCGAMGRFAQQVQHVVRHTLVRGVRLRWPDPDSTLASTSAISQARYRLGARPVVDLCRRVCQPLATRRRPVPSSAACG